MNLAKAGLILGTMAMALSLGAVPPPANPITPDLPSAARNDDDHCVPFGGTIYGWHDGEAWNGVGDFAVGRKVSPATIVDPNTSFFDYGDMWLGTETAHFDFGNGDTVDLMTEFVVEHGLEAASAAGILHVNETGTFANGTGRFRNAWGRFNSQGPFGPGVTLPPQITPGANIGMFWIGQYAGTICGVD